MYEDEDYANEKILVAVIGSLLWPVGIPIVLICLGIRYVRENFLP